MPVSVHPGPFRRALPPPPAHLDATESGLWKSLQAEYDLADTPALAILASTLEAHARARKCREQIDQEGPTTVDRFGQIRVHPLMAAERDARAAFLAGMRCLNLDLTGETKK